MTPSYVTGTDLRVGLPVEYLGESDPVPVLDEKLQAIGLALYSGHPGLAADHVSIPGIKPRADHGVTLSQLRPGQRDAPRVERRDRHQLPGHAPHPSDHPVT